MQTKADEEERLKACFPGMDQRLPSFPQRRTGLAGGGETKQPVLGDQLHPLHNKQPELDWLHLLLQIPGDQIREGTWEKRCFLPSITNHFFFLPTVPTSRCYWCKQPARSGPVSRPVRGSTTELCVCERETRTHPWQFHMGKRPTGKSIFTMGDSRRIFQHRTICLYDTELRQFP